MKLSLVLKKGFEAGVKSVNKDISVDVQYAEDFNNPEKVELLQRPNTLQELTSFTKLLVVQELVSSRKQKT